MWIKYDLLTKIKALFVEKAQGSTNANKTLSTDSNGNVIMEAKNNHTHSYAPISHESTNTTYGEGNATNYGHVKVDNSLSSSSTNTVQNKVVYNGLYEPVSISGTNIDFNNYTTPGMWYVWASEEVNNTNAPDKQGGLLIVKKIPNGVVQTLVQYWAPEPKVFYRIYHNSAGWREWVTVTSSYHIDAKSGSTKDLNNYTVAGFYYCKHDTNEAQYVSNLPESGKSFWLLVEDWGASNYTKQTLTHYATQKTYIRIRTAGTWGSWNEVSYSTHTHGNVLSDGTMTTSDTTNIYAYFVGINGGSNKMIKASKLNSSQLYDNTSQNYGHMGLSATNKTQKEINNAINTKLGEKLSTVDYSGGQLTIQ